MDIEKKSSTFAYHRQVYWMDLHIRKVDVETVGIECKKAYREGAQEALRSQWRDASVEFPELRDVVMVALECGDAYAFDFAYRIKSDRGTTHEWRFNNRNGFSTKSIRFWMPIPELPEPPKQ